MQSVSGIVFHVTKVSGSGCFQCCNDLVQNKRLLMPIVVPSFCGSICGFAIESNTICKLITKITYIDLTNYCKVTGLHIYILSEWLP